MKTRRGVTLVELLIVIAVASLLAAVALPSMKTVLKDRKTNQAAMLVRAILEDAKVKAISSGRSIAVVLERSNFQQFSTGATTSGDAYSANACLRMSIAEVLPPYQGDFEESVGILSITPIPNPPSGYPAGWPPDRPVADTVTITDPGAAMFLQEGNEISFGDNQERFVILSVTAASAPFKAPFVVRFNNYRPVLRRNPMNFEVLTPPNYVSPVVPGPAVDLAVGPTPFRVHSKPRRLYSLPVELPKGTCIDLSLSGLGNQTYDSSQAPFYSSGRSSSLETTRRSSGAMSTSSSIRFASDEIDRVNTPAASALLDSQFRPVYIVFNSRGEISKVWTNGYESGTMAGFVPNNSIFLMVGRTDRVPFDSTGSTTLTLESRFDPVSAASNLWDPTAYWVRVGLAGQVSVGPNTTPASADPLPADTNIPSYGSILAHCRQAAIGGNDLSGK